MNSEQSVYDHWLSVELSNYFIFRLSSSTSVGALLLLVLWKRSPLPTRHRPWRSISLCNRRDSNSFHCCILIAWSFFMFSEMLTPLTPNPLVRVQSSFFYAALFGHIAHVKVRRASIDQQQSHLEIQSRSACLNSKGFHEKPWSWEWSLGYPVVFQIRCSPSQLPQSLLCPDVANVTSPYLQLCCRYHPLSRSLHTCDSKNDFMILWMTGNDWYYRMPNLFASAACDQSSSSLRTSCRTRHQTSKTQTELISSSIVTPGRHVWSWASSAPFLRSSPSSVRTCSNFSNTMPKQNGEKPA